MPKGYNSNAQLPKEVRASLPRDAQDVYRLAYNSAVAGSSEHPEGQAWAAVEQGWVGTSGVWIRRSTPD